MGPIGIVLSARHKHSTPAGTPAGTSTKHRHIRALHKALPNTAGAPPRVLVGCVCSGLVGGMPCMAHAALLACVGELAFIVRVCLRWFPALVHDCLCNPIASLCNKQWQNPHDRIELFETQFFTYREVVLSSFQLNYNNCERLCKNS